MSYDAGWNVGVPADTPAMMMSGGARTFGGWPGSRSDSRESLARAWSALRPLRAAPRDGAIRWTSLASVWVHLLLLLSVRGCEPAGVTRGPLQIVLLDVSAPHHVQGVGGQAVDLARASRVGERGSQSGGGSQSGSGGAAGGVAPLPGAVHAATATEPAEGGLATGGRGAEVPAAPVTHATAGSGGVQATDGGAGGSGVAGAAERASAGQTWVEEVLDAPRDRSTAEAGERSVEVDVPASAPAPDPATPADEARAVSAADGGLPVEEDLAAAPAADAVDELDASADWAPEPLPLDARVDEAAAPEPDPEPPEPDPRDGERLDEDPGTEWQVFVDTTGLTPADADPDARLISSQSVAHDLEARSSVFHETPGVGHQEQVHEHPADPAPSLVQHRGVQEPSRGSRVERTATTQLAVPRAGGGQMGLVRGEGSPETGQRVTGSHASARGGGSVGPGSAAGGGRPAVALGTAGDAVDGPAVAPEGERPMPSSDTPWWSPTVFRVQVVQAPSAGGAPSTRPADAPVAPPGPARTVRPPSFTHSDGVSMSERTSEDADRGGTERAADEEAWPGPEVSADAGELEAAEGSADLVDDFMASMGWDGVDRASLYPQEQLAGTADSEHATQASPRAVFETDEVADFVWVTARGTALGEYHQRNYDEVLGRWMDMDLPVHERARSIQGTTVIEFRVHRSGKVSELQVVRSSGHLALDTMAMRAVPRRLARFPRSVRRELEGADFVMQRMTFTYRNPVVVTQ